MLTDIASDQSTGVNLVPASSLESQIDFVDDADFFRVELNSGHNYIFLLLGNGSDPRLTLIDPMLSLVDATSHLVTFDDDGGRGLDGRVAYSPTESGTFYVVASAYVSTGTYRLTVQDLPKTDDHGHSAYTATWLTLDHWIAGAINFSGDQDWFGMHLDAGIAYEFKLSGQDGLHGTLADPVLALYDNQGAMVAFSDDDGNTMDARIQVTPTVSGTYILRAFAAYDDAVGSYEIYGRAAEQPTLTFDALRYAASNPDLGRAFGTDEAALQRHYIDYGRAEGRATKSFDALLYAASNPDLARGFGPDASGLARHYIEHGLREGRATSSFDWLGYAASNPDLARAFELDASGLARHYVEHGLFEGRSASGFDALLYAASNPDLGQAIGADEAALKRHYVNFGLAEGRPMHGFDALLYAVANPDLAAAFGTDMLALEHHYVAYGLAEGRSSGVLDPLL